MNVPGNQPAIVSLIVSAMPDVHEPGMRFVRPEALDMPPGAPEPCNTDPADAPQSELCTDVASCTTIGFMIAILSNCAMKLLKTLLSDDSDSLPVSRKSSHMESEDD